MELRRLVAVRLGAVEVGAPAQDQRLADQLLRPPVTDLDRAVLVRLADVDPADVLEAEVLAHVREALVEAASVALAQLVGRRRHVVEAELARHAAELPQRALEAIEYAKRKGRETSSSSGGAADVLLVGVLAFLLLRKRRR